jgi:hypothetical protein
MPTSRNRLPSTPEAFRRETASTVPGRFGQGEKIGEICRGLEVSEQRYDRRRRLAAR